MSITSVMWSGVVLAEYYRWKDKNGGTQYGDQVPVRKQQKELVKLNDSRNRFIDRGMEQPEWIHSNELKVLSRFDILLGSKNILEKKDFVSVLVKICSVTKNSLIDLLPLDKRSNSLVSK